MFFHVFSCFFPTFSSLFSVLVFLLSDLSTDGRTSLGGPVGFGSPGVGGRVGGVSYHSYLRREREGQVDGGKGMCWMGLLKGSG